MLFLVQCYSGSGGTFQNYIHINLEKSFAGNMKKKKHENKVNIDKNMDDMGMFAVSIASNIDAIFDYLFGAVK